MKSADFQRQSDAQHVASPNPDNPDDRVLKVRRLMNEYVERRKILDIGCADGAVLKPFVGKHELHGVDLSPEYLRGATELGFSTLVHDIESDPLPYENGTFDVVVAGETIEHIVDTDWLLAEVNRVLKPNGHFIVTYPNVRTPVSLGMMLFMDMPPMYSARYRGPHYRDFTLRIMRIALGNHCFRADKIWGTHFHLPGLGDCWSGLATRFPAWASQVVLRAVKTGESRYSPEQAARKDIYAR
jgi:SAM-dependent methyltransferase